MIRNACPKSDCHLGDRHSLGMTSMIILGLLLALPAQAAEIKAYADRSEVTVGDKVKYTLEIEHDPSDRIQFMDGGDFGGFAVKDFGDSEGETVGDGKIRKKRTYALDTFTAGSYVIPPQVVQVISADGLTSDLESAEIFVEVQSLVGASEGEATLRDIKPPLSFSSSVWGVVILLLLLIMASMAVIFGRRFLMKKEIPIQEPAKLAHQIAFSELNRIRQLDLFQKKRVKEFYYLVSQCLRLYLENRFGLRAPEQTTEEFIESIVHGGKLEGRYVNILKEYLEHCDLVKYAQLEPQLSQSRQLIETTEKFIQETKEQPVELQRVGMHSSEGSAGRSVLRQSSALARLRNCARTGQRNLQEEPLRKAEDQRI